jgi:hypothetical protein
MKKIWRKFEIFIGLIALAWFLDGCAGTVTRNISPSKTASYDGNKKDSGVIGIRPNGDRIVTADFIARYQSYLNSGLGKYCSPPLTTLTGVSKSSPGVFNVQAQSFVNFCLMRDLKDSGF